MSHFAFSSDRLHWAPGHVTLAVRKRHLDVVGEVSLVCRSRTTRIELLDPVKDAKWIQWFNDLGKTCEACFYPERKKLKLQANKLVGRAIKKGQLVRGVCEVCGTSERVHAHHDDYGKPLSVRWLCAKHHLEWHRTNTPLVPDLGVSA